MPSDTDIPGFSSSWYPDGISSKIRKMLPDGIEIFVFPFEYYLAAKFEAHNDRCGNDIRQSHDFEDIIYILDNADDIMSKIRIADTSVRMYLKEEWQEVSLN